jgi:hypothetical protein
MSSNEERAVPALPVVRGDWIESTGDGQPRIGKVVNSTWYVDADGVRQCMIDMALFAYSGDRIGRESPVLGGPRTYEPWITYTGEWRRIEKPEFPISLGWVPMEDGSAQFRWVTGAKHLEDRSTAPRKKITAGRGRVIPKSLDSDYDPELEIRTRRMAAQELRDINRAMPVPELVKKAEKLEAEAAGIAREYGVER